MPCLACALRNYTNMGVSGVVYSCHSSNMERFETETVSNIDARAACCILVYVPSASNHRLGSHFIINDGLNPTAFCLNSR
jgi:hypothetical protein